MMAGAFVSADTFINAQRERARLVAIVAEEMKTSDLLMMPTRQMVAPVLGGYDSSTGPSLTRPFNMTGYPALSVCNGFNSAGLPISLQIAGRPFEDHIVLKAGDAYEKATGYRKVRPTLSTPLDAQARGYAKARGAGSGYGSCGGPGPRPAILRRGTAERVPSTDALSLETRPRTQALGRVLLQAADTICLSRMNSFKDRPPSLGPCA
jgi:hypothetical protein